MLLETRIALNLESEEDLPWSAPGRLHSCLYAEIVFLTCNIELYANAYAKIPRRTITAFFSAIISIPLFSKLINIS